MPSKSNKKSKSTKDKVNSYNLLHLLHKAKPATRHHILHYLNDDGLHCIGEFVHNTLFRRCSLTPRQTKLLKKKLGSYKKSYRKIATKSTPSEVRRRLLQEQSGSGIFSTLLGIGIPLITDLIFGKKK